MRGWGKIPFVVFTYNQANYHMKTILLICSLWITPINDSSEWIYDFDAAKQSAKESNKTVLIVFSGSDWCKPCIQLHKELFESVAFNDYAKSSLVLLKADFPYKKKNRLSKEQTAHNEALASQYNPNGEFPLGVFTDTTGKVLGTFGYDKSKTPTDYINQFKQYLK